MKAHLIISESEFNRKRILHELQNLLRKSSSNYSSYTSFFKNEHYQAPDAFKKIYEDPAKVQVLFDFPSDLVTALKPNGNFRIIFTNADHLQSVYNGGYNDYHVFYVSRYKSELQSKKLAKYLFYTVNKHFINTNNWSDQVKKSTLEFLTKKEVKAYQDFIDVIKVNKLELVNG